MLEEDALTQETPEVEPSDSPQGTPETPETDTPDYEKQYKDTQAAYTQSQQELAEYRDYVEKLRTDEQERRSLLEELADEFGIALPDQEEEYLDPGELALREVQELREAQAKARSEFEESQHWDQERDRFHEALESYQGKNNVQFTEDEINFAGARIILEGAEPDKVFAALDRLGQARYERIVEAKKDASRAPSGVQGSPTLDHANRDEVEDAAIQAAQEAFTQE